MKIVFIIVVLIFIVAIFATETLKDSNAGEAASRHVQVDMLVCGAVAMHAGYDSDAHYIGQAAMFSSMGKVCEAGSVSSFFQCASREILKTKNVDLDIIRGKCKTHFSGEQAKFQEDSMNCHNGNKAYVDKYIFPTVLTRLEDITSLWEARSRFKTNTPKAKLDFYKSYYAENCFY